MRETAMKAIEQLRFGRGHRARLAPAIAALVAAGCSLLVDAEKQQCEGNEQCLEIFAGDVGYSCVSGSCVRPACETTDACRARGVGYAASICGADDACASPECESSAQCNGGVCDTDVGRCIAASQRRPRVRHG